MKKMFVYLSLIAMVLNISCGNDNLLSFEKLNLTVKDVELTDVPFMRFPLEIKLLNDKIIILDGNASENFFHVFSRAENKYIGSFGPRGRGPLEIISGSGVICDDCNTFFVFEPTGKMLEYNLDNLIMNSLLIPDTVIDFSHLSPLACVTCVDDGFISFNMTGINHRLNHFDKEGQLKEKLFTFPIPTEDTPEQARYNQYLGVLWSCKISYDKERNLLACATLLGDVIDVFDMNRKELKYSITGKEGAPEVVPVSGGLQMGRITGYTDLCISNNKIFALFDGENIQKSSMSEDKSSGSKTIRVFNLEDGKPVYQIDLDRKINAIVVDEKQKIIYAADPNNENILCEIDLSMVPN